MEKRKYEDIQIIEFFMKAKGRRYVNINLIIKETVSRDRQVFELTKQEIS